MKYLRKIGVSLVIFAFIFQSISMPIYAMSSEEQILTEDLEMAAILLDEDEESVPLYEEDSETSKILVLLESDEEVIVLDKLDDFSFVEYIEKSDEEEVFQGFILNDFLNFNKEDDLDEDTFDDVEDSEKENSDESADESESENDSNTNESEVENAEDPKNLPKDEPIDEVEEDEGIEIEEEDLEEVEIEEKEATSNENTEEIIVEKHQTFSVQSASLSEETFLGIALKDKTHVYTSQSTSSTKLRSYEQGSTLKYRSLNANWYEATVMYNGKWTKGYIHKNDVENITDSQAVLHGVALQNPTKVYGRASTGANTLRTYAQGSILKYKTLTSNWYEATVMYNGKWTTGYIHKNDVENSITNQTRLQGIGTQNPTTVFASASTGSKKLKSYAQGSILTYRTFSSNWYQATVYINGKATTGYIHKNHVETPVTNQTRLQGIGTQSPTTVYASASTGSKKLKSYAQGSILTYRTFSNNWYQATVYINGKATTGYIHKSHVENSVTNQTRLQGIGTQNPTTVFASASTGSKKLKSYAQGSILTYRTFSNNWYQATVYINGKATTGYIHKNHVEELYDTQKRLDGRAIKSPTHVYSRASKSSNSLRGYAYGSPMIFRTFSKNWYQATVYINGKPNTGYIHANDVTTGDVVNNTNYNYAFKNMVDAQMVPGYAKADGAGNIDATRGQVEFYSNPLNFVQGSVEYYQFLVLSQTAGLNAKEINEKVLKGKGHLEGQAQAFIDAGKKYNINEAYLIGHALHETGNGNSTLASGVPVDKDGNVTRDAQGNIARTSRTAHTVYNMYGYGAYDHCPTDCGAKKAFEEKWFTPADSILGAVKLIHTYIGRGQDTLYKMKWNPTNPGYPQYATHVEWATIQTKYIHSIYSLIVGENLIYDIPTFSSQPIYKDGVYGITQASSLNFRSGPGTGNPSIGITIPNGSRIQIIGSDPTGWYNITYEGKTGWVSAKYVNLIY